MKTLAPMIIFFASVVVIAFALYTIMDGVGRQDFLESLTITCGGATLLLAVMKANRSLTTSYSDARSGVRSEDSIPIRGKEELSFGWVTFGAGLLATVILYVLSH